MENPLAREWMARTLAGLAPALREIAEYFHAPDSVEAQRDRAALALAADTIERAAARLSENKEASS